MEQKKIDRINELAKLAKERELTDEEKANTHLNIYRDEECLGGGIVCA